MEASGAQRDEILRLIPGPVTVVGAAAAGVLGGLTASWVTRVSQEPPLLLVAIGRERYTWQLLRNASHFTVSLLGEGQVAEARLFGLCSRREVDKWALVEHDLLGPGVPALRHCAARFLCGIEDRFATGDHDCLIGRVVEVGRGAAEMPLPLRGSDYIPDRQTGR
jgi:flavin reductase (DIM6/NTAB) family NADH-FMN oxidoreductase RutF